MSIVIFVFILHYLLGVEGILQLEGWYNSHKEAVEKVLTLPSTTRDVGKLLSSAHAREKEVNRHCLLKILTDLRLLARQGCAIRGHSGENDGNFHRLLKLRSEDDKTVS